MKNKVRIFAAAVAGLLVGAQAQAVQFDGFLTAGAAIHDDENKNRYIGSLGDRGVIDDVSFETDTRFGLQISSDIAENMDVVAQILGTGVNGNFDAIVEWAYIDYELNKNVSVRAGKIKQPVYLVNDYVEVGYAYPWIRPPVEVYYLNNPLNTVNGVEFLFQLPVGPGSLQLQPYFGSNRDDIPNTSGQGFFEAENIVGLDIKYAGRGYSVHASHFECDVKIFGFVPGIQTGFGFDVDLNLGGSAGKTGECEVDSVGFNFDIRNLVVYAEWQERTTTDGLSQPFGDQDAWYTTVGYRMGKWMPHITFASIDGKYSDFGLSSGSGAVECGEALGCDTTPIGGPGVVPQGTGLLNFPISIQTSVTAGLRYELNDSAALKIEHSVVDVENDFAEITSSGNPLGINFGLFDTTFTGAPPTEKVGITSIALDIIF